MRKTIEYTSFDEDIIQARNQNLKLPENYKWVHNNLIYNLLSDIVYSLLWLVGYFYQHFYLHLKVIGKEKFRTCQNEGYFLYINHTQPFGDPFLPSQLLTKRYYAICAPSNLSVPILGKILPITGALPIPDTIKQMREFKKAIKLRIEQKHVVVIFPEAHVWPYYTKIRDMQDGSFQFPLDCKAPSFTATCTYQKGRHKKPDLIVYIDGPFYPDATLKRAAARKKLKSEIVETMKNESKHSNENYIEYRKKEAEE